MVDFKEHYSAYTQRLNAAFGLVDEASVTALAETLLRTWRERRQLFICGNGGSAGNAIHLANDFIYGIAKHDGIGMRVEALSANAAVLTCLANDISYAEIYAQQLRVKAQAGDMLIVLSGSGNSPNVVRALEVGNEMGMETFALLGYSGGKCKDLAKVAVHVAMDDMQIAEDMQLVIGHACMQYLYENAKPT
jgi:D-sedoheptulose 7-phosphate isomerase